jgi:hypothetical protein
MQKMVRWRRRFVSLLVVGMLAPIAAECAAGASTSDDEMACCQSGQHDCGPSGDVAECCAVTAPSSRQVIVAKADSPFASVRALLLTISPAQPVVVHASPQLSTLDVIPLQERLGSGPPPYIAFSTLLI